jgi:hypothetical protein
MMADISPMQHLYAFADHSDLYKLEERLVHSFAAFAGSWSVEGAAAQALLTIAAKRPEVIREVFAL